MPDIEHSTTASNTFATAEVVPGTHVAHHSATTEGNGDVSTKTGSVTHQSGVTKVVTTHTSTKIVSNKIAIGNERDITHAMATMNANPHVMHHEEMDTPAEDRKVSFPQDALSSRNSTAHTTEHINNSTNNIIYSGRILKYGYRLFGNSWHPVDLTIHRDGHAEWRSVDADHSHNANLKDLRLGMIAIGRACLDIPTYISPKISKDINPDYLIAIGKHSGSKVKSFWFAAQSDKELADIKSALSHVLGPQYIDIPAADVKKVWSGQGDIQVSTSVVDSSLSHHAGKNNMNNTTTTSTVSSRQPNNMVNINNIEHQRASSTSPTDGPPRSLTPQKRNKAAKEAFFADILQGDSK
ncbi:hypothetical protein RvY_17649 [Ramazzottius varieornatus]|uniref:Uncharacterized protein n=1 Tax=Ramazzottius varieornatus TaxID=947166 RepID=A0A1D1W2X1_RAMVA|nr:hypothetical protein RvY_17649 [Ramazzottius varieornatus]